MIIIQTLDDQIAKEKADLARKSDQTSANFIRDPKDRLTELRQKTDRNVVEGLELQELEIGLAESKKINAGLTSNAVEAQGAKEVAKRLDKAQAPEEEEEEVEETTKTYPKKFQAPKA